MTKLTTKNQAEWEEEFDRLFVPQNKINRTGSISMERYLGLIRGQKHFISTQIKIEKEKIIEVLEEMKRNYEYDKEAHIQGKCSHSPAICSAIEHEIKMIFSNAIQKIKENNL